MPFPKKKIHLPVIWSPEEVACLIDAAPIPFYRTILMTLYGTGERRPECAAFKLTDIDVARMVVHVHDGKGGKDRDIVLIPHLLDELRSHYRRLARKPAVWLFPGGRWHAADDPISDKVVWHEHPPRTDAQKIRHQTRQLDVPLLQQALQLVLKSDLGARQLVLPPRHRSQEPLLLIRHEAQNQLFRHQPLHHPFGVQEIVLAPTRPVVALGLAQVECAPLLVGPLSLLSCRAPEHLQRAPPRPPVLGGRFHDDFFDLQFHQPLGQHVQFAGGGAEFTAFKLILACPFHVGHDNCQHPLVNVNGCYSIRHHASPWRRGEHAKRYSQAGSRGYRRSREEDERRPIIRAEAQHAPGSNRRTISTSSLSKRPHRSRLYHDPSFSWDFAGRRPIQTDDANRSSVLPFVFQHRLQHGDLALQLALASHHHHDVHPQDQPRHPQSAVEEAEIALQSLHLANHVVGRSLQKHQCVVHRISVREHAPSGAANRFPAGTLPAAGA